MAEPEYVWVEEDRIPGSLTTAIFGRQAVVAAPHVVPRYAPPPGGGPISPLQGGPPTASLVEGLPAAGPRDLLRSEPAAPGGPLPSPSQEAAVRDPTPRGYVVHVQTGLVVVDLSAADGVRKGSLLSIRRGGVPLVHPVTRQPLGELADEEIGTARVVEVRERFSVAQIESLRSGVEPQVRDRVVITQP
jgi:hypothetical protein